MIIRGCDASGVATAAAGPRGDAAKTSGQQALAGVDLSAGCRSEANRESERRPAGAPDKREEAVLLDEKVVYTAYSTGKFMRHVKLRSGQTPDATALMKLIETAYTDMKTRLKAE
ncbi:hypothetical protein [Nitrococcus mobilis]|uniref:Uncharacterized protein n=1 Tax=Nitrococcus mobilis Nb-231 TaxID=314278 RepID=A4BQC2_9GAMM|nr:hypothetical protein [Nitrococcus mobilis]EAR22277.1 hypothetical protein NB231_05190 [Nitrococcus mobilis Nb-231]